MTAERSASTTEAEYLAVDNEFGHIDGVLRRRARGRSPVVVLQTHPRAPSLRNLTEWPCLDLPAQGVDTFGYNNRFTNSAAGIEIVTVWEDFALDLACAVAEMRRRGYRSIVLYGFSAGGPLVSFYQNLAEHGNSILRPDRSLSGFSGFVRDGTELRLPPADGIILQNGTTGTASSFLTRLDGSIVDETRARRDPALDPFEPSNGFDPISGAAEYSDRFLTDYFRAQCARMNRLVRLAQDLQARTRSGRGSFRDDDVLVIPGVRAEPASVDLALASTTRRPWLLEPQHRTKRIASNRAVVPGYRERNRNLRDGGAVHTVSSFLSYRAVLTDPERHHPDAVTAEEGGVDLLSTNTSTGGNLAGISVPLLITAGTADTQVHLPHAELAYNSATAAQDKELVCIDGAEHDMRPAAPRFGDTRAAHLDVLARWLIQRFSPEG